MRGSPGEVIITFLIILTCPTELMVTELLYLTTNYIILYITVCKIIDKTITAVQTPL